ncbi:glycosyl transferase, partial [bacterium]
MNRLLLLLISGDILCALAGISMGFLVRFGSVPNLFDINSAEFQQRIFFVLAVLFSSFFVELYRIDTESGWKDLAVRIGFSLFFAFILLSSLYYLFPAIMFGRGVLVLALCSFGLFQFTWQVLFRVRANLPVFATRVLILGVGPLAERIGSLISAPN